MAEPSTVAGLAYRLRADDLTGAANSQVDSWPDVSNRGHPPAVQSSSARRPLLRYAAINGLKAVEFDGVDDVLSLSGSALSIGASTTGLYAVVVSKQQATRTGLTAKIHLSLGSPGFSYQARFGLRTEVNGGVTALFYGPADGINTQGNSSVVEGTTAWRAIEASYSWPEDDAYLYHEGAQTGANIFSTFRATSPATPSVASSIGATHIDGDYAPILLAEVLIYDQVPDDAGRAAIKSYVQDIYGITVSGYVADDPTVRQMSANRSAMSAMFPGGM